jgi:hypothetical protein
MRPSLRFWSTSSVSILVIPTNTAHQFSAGMNEKKQTSYKVLMGLIVLMFALQTIHNICNWYITWLGFIYYGDAPDQALNALEVDPTSLSLLVVDAIFILLATLRLAIADSVMVSIHPSRPTNTILMTFNVKVWRCWIICNNSWMAVIVPLVVHLGSIGM